MGEWAVYQKAKKDRSYVKYRKRPEWRSRQEEKQERETPSSGNESDKALWRPA